MLDSQLKPDVNPVSISNSDLKFLGHVLAKDFQQNGKHIDKIKEEYLKTNKYIGTPPYFLVTFDYTNVPLNMSIKALSPLAFYHRGNESGSDENFSEDDDSDDDPSDDDHSGQEANGDEELYTDESDGGHEQDALDTYEDISKEWDDALRRGGEAMVAVRVIVPRGEVPQVMTALLRPIEPERGSSDNGHSSGDDRISGEQEEKWVGLSWIHST